MIIWQITGDGEATPFEGAALVAAFVILAHGRLVRVAADRPERRSTIDAPVVLF